VQQGKELTRDCRDVVKKRLHRRKVTVSVDIDVASECSVVREHAKGDVRVDDVGVRAVDEVREFLHKQRFQAGERKSACRRVMAGKRNAFSGANSGGWWCTCARVRGGQVVVVVVVVVVMVVVNARGEGRA
jgi:hypothetical protein